MLFPTIAFAVFFAIVLTANWALARRPVAWRLFMLAASWFFYGWWDARFVVLLAASTVANQLLARRMAATDDEGARRRTVVVAVVLNLGILGFFKYYGFFVESAEGLLHGLGLQANLPLLQVILPVGISFFTFQALSYVIDVYRGRIGPTTLLRFGVYLSFFPQLVAGPIVRASEFLPQLDAPREPGQVEAGRGFRLIAGGLFKKVVIADTLATHLVDRVFAAPQDFTSLEILAGVYGYAVQIYCDFSAYSDIAIGCALLMGLRFPDNFDSPYTARSLQEFWRRWHMTLSRWLRDYLYVPLGGSRLGRARTYRNLMITMLLGGLWHGASWMFVLWGGLHGGWLAGERWLRERRERSGRERRPDGWGRRLLHRLLIFHIVCLGWVLFRSESMAVVGEILGRLGSAWGPAPAVTLPVVSCIAVGIGAQFVPKAWMERWELRFGGLHPAVQGVALAGVLWVVDVLGADGVAAFIYFQF